MSVTFYINKEQYKFRTDIPTTWYSCGPTVYDKSHLGHARTYIMIDVIQRILKSKNITLLTGMNITDVDDKILKRANEESIPAKTITIESEKQFWSSLDKLNVIKPDLILRATESINDILLMIQTMIDKEYAYESNGSVYMRTGKAVKMFGQPFGLHIDKSVVYNNKFVDEKESPSDFVLWKKGKKGETLLWDSPWSKGRPGWHIECSAMVNRMFGSHLNIHSGGIDLRFPHHSNEYLQSMAYNDDNVPWVDNFIHIGHLHINKEKMSKSEKNFITIDEALTKYSANSIRFAFLLNNFTKTMDWSDEFMEYANSILDKFVNCQKKANNVLYRATQGLLLSKANIELFNTLTRINYKINETIYHLDQLPKIVKLIENGVDTFNLLDNTIHQRTAKLMIQILNTLSVFGIELDQKQKTQSNDHLQIILKIREELRNKKQYELSDKIRDVYLKPFQIEDN